MSDRELLEKAAKAAGVEFAWRPYPAIKEREGCWAEWNPLAEDGEALRLAVKLFITVSPGHDRCTASWWGGPLGITQGEASILVVNGDVEAAMRRAIVRAAAALAGDTGEAAK